MYNYCRNYVIFFVSKAAADTGTFTLLTQHFELCVWLYWWCLVFHVMNQD